MKTCKKCGENKKLSRFAVETHTKSGYAVICKDCVNLARRTKYAEDSEYKAKRLANNKKAIEASGITPSEYQKIWKSNNEESYKAIRERTYQKNRVGYMLRAKQRKAYIKERTPSWLTELDHFVIRCIYDKARELTDTYGIPFEVDHIIPLRGETVSGLHCPSNLQILAQSENRAKRNTFIQESV